MGGLLFCRHKNSFIKMQSSFVNCLTFATIPSYLMAVNLLGITMFNITRECTDIHFVF